MAVSGFRLRARLGSPYLSGLPVPHRTGHEFFPHPAPHGYSLRKQDLPSCSSRERRSRESSGRIIYLPTFSASSLVLALTLLWTLKPVWRHPMIFSTSASEMSSSLRKRAKTSRANIWGLGGCPGKKRDDGTSPQSLRLPRSPENGGAGEDLYSVRRSGRRPPLRG